jgi:DNA polymerase-3 subunit gamma/tau
MASQVFYRKWRSQNLAELVGQPHVTQTLLNALKNGNISHAYLFCGPRGTGKTSTARILAKAVNCLTTEGRGEPCNTCEMCQAITQDRAMDVIEIDAASNRGIDDIRDLREKVNYAPTQARRKVYIIDEFHMLSKDASNALLKTLEEPPPHVIFILATTEAHKVLATILSRCQHFEFHRLGRTDVIGQLTKVSAAENINIDAQALQLIAKSSTGSLRDAYNLLEQLATFYGSDIHFQQVQSMLGITGDSRAREIVKHLISNDLSAGMAALNSVSNDGLDLRQFNRELVEYLRSLLLVKTGAAESVDLTVEDIAELKELAAQASLAQILNAVKLFGQVDLGTSENSALPLELALVDCYLGSVPTPLVEKPPAVVQNQIKATPVKSVNHPIKPLAASVETFKTPVSADSAEIKIPAVPVKKTASEKPEQTEKVIEVKSEAVRKEAEVRQDNPVAAPTLASEIERLRLNWKQILENLPANLIKTKAVALLRSGGSRPVSIENDTVVISLKYGIIKDNLEKPEYLQVVEKIIGGYLGHTCKVRCVCEVENNHLVKAALKSGAQITSVEEK